MDDRDTGKAARDGKTARVYVGLGGNTGARALLIDEAVRRIATVVGPVVATSFLYETAPQLVTDQPPFLNAAVLVESRIIDPHALMRALQSIEAAMGRAPLSERPRYGPRPIDLDILCYDDGVTTINSVDLVVPHALLRTRSFVLRPLVDIRPDLLVPPGTGSSDGAPATVAQLWDALAAKADESLPRRVLPLGAHRVFDLDALAARRTPLLMAIVNATPDSFSGDGIHAHVGDAKGDGDTVSFNSLVEQTVARGANVVDVGGYSTRPGHAIVSVDDETHRVMCFVSSIATTLSDGDRENRGDKEGYCDRGREATTTSPRELLLSIDTFRPEVARACVEALAPSHHRRDAVVWINDVMGMRCDPLAMADLLRQHDGVGIVIMHSRGALDSMIKDPVTAAGLLAPHPKEENGDDGKGNDDDIVARVAHDLLTTAAWAEAHGVARWRIMLDPGIGFGKSLADNVALAGGAARLRAALGGYPVLIGASRKSFLGKATAAAAKKRARDAGRTDDDPGDLSDETRQHASHAVTAIAAWEGAHIVRVHDVVGSRAVLDIAAALANGPAASAE
ncbi:HPPK domain and Pterin binding domain containing protein [Pandoravirus salinus]|uniref:2-amino-4-hydroxy-6-hydroxymethyldihydropteridine diphosphokinase n=1 Tax=Pandoravirus salinus TaxID=1349410 RepID=S4W084_9VIRU|nr:HPPK domain and Pterin binding domain containing protein [Pandoravirus salinus]AGO83465.1 HPPK domain and Pterin binding domain containing protein [Pandoravirus salinus]